jgi:hypothetical protein
MSNNDRKKDQQTRQISEAEATRRRFKAQIDRFSRLSVDERSAYLDEVAALARDDFAALIGVLDDRLSRTDHLPVLALLTSRYLVETSLRPAHAEVVEKPISMSHMEILQAFYLRHLPAKPFSSTVTQACQHEEVRQFVDNANVICAILIRLQTAFYERDLNTPSTDSSLSRLSDSLRGQTQLVRYWGFEQQVYRISRDVLTGLDRTAIDELGYPLSPIISGLYAAITIIETRLKKIQ